MHKNVVVGKSLHNFNNAEPNDPNGFKEELKTKYNSVLAVVEKFLNRTGPMMKLPQAETPPLGWTNYCAIDVADQAIWEKGVMSLLRQCFSY